MDEVLPPLQQDQPSAMNESQPLPLLRHVLTTSGQNDTYAVGLIFGLYIDVLDAEIASFSTDTNNPPVEFPVVDVGRVWYSINNTLRRRQIKKATQGPGDQVLDSIYLPNLSDIRQDARGFVPRVLQEIPSGESWESWCSVLRDFKLSDTVTIKVSKANIFLLREIMKDSTCKEIVLNFLRSQPKADFAGNNSKEVTDPLDPCPGLTYALIDPCLTEDAALCILQFFGELVYGIGAIILLPRGSDYDGPVNKLKSWIRTKISSPFGNMILEHREMLSRVDMGDTMLKLFQGILDALKDDRYGDTRFCTWNLHVYFIGLVKYVMNKEKDAGKIIKTLRQLGWEGLLTNNPVPVEYYVPPGLHVAIDLEDGAFSGWMEYRPVDFEDVRWEATDEPRTATFCDTLGTPVPAEQALGDARCTICIEGFRYADPEWNSFVVRTPWMVHCQGRHVFHQNCLIEHINGIQAYSTQCPECRGTICEPREKRPVSSEPARRDEGPEDEDEGSHQQVNFSRDGDVIMGDGT